MAAKRLIGGAEDFTEQKGRLRQRDRTDAGFQAHLPKPADPAELIAVVAHVAGRT